MACSRRLAASRVVRAHRAGLVAQWRTLAVAAVAVAVYPLAFYSSMRLAGVAVGTVVSIGSGPLAAALVERVVDRRPLSRRWALGAAAGLLGILALAVSRTGHAEPATGERHPVLGIALGLLAGLTYALYSWGAARMMRGGLPTRPVMGAVFGLGGVLLMPVLLLTGAPILETGRNLAVVAYLAVVPMFVGYVLFGRGLAGRLRDHRHHAVAARARGRRRDRRPGPARGTPRPGLGGHGGPARRAWCC